jgi:RNA:NAD 2'-phosphotransferase (TPT1/KptA family)
MADAGRKNEVVQRRLEMILTRRVKFLDMTIYKGGFVKISDLLTKAPVFQRFAMTADELKTCVTGNDQYELSGTDYIRAKSGHSFDINAVDLLDVPTA